MKLVKMSAVMMRPYAAAPAKVEPVPDMVARFIDGDFKEMVDHASVKIDTDREDTGQGMSYKNRLIVRDEKKVAYDTGMLTWRDGRGGYPTIDADCFRKAGLLRRDDTLYLGIEDGEGKVKIRQLPNGYLVESYDVAMAKKNKVNAELRLNDLKALRSHFRNTYNRGEQYPWKIGGADTACDLGTGFMAYHNRDSGRGGEVWNKFVVIIVHDGRPYISDEIPVSLNGDNWCLSHRTSCKVEGNTFTVGVACCHYKSTPSTPDYQVAFELCMKETVSS